MLVIYGTCKQIFILEKQSSGSVLKKCVLRNFAGKLFNNIAGCYLQLCQKGDPGTSVFL